MPELDVTAEFEVFCEKCGAGLCHTVNVKRGNQVYIPPCEECMSNSYDEGYEKGREVNNE